MGKSKKQNAHMNNLNSNQGESNNRNWKGDKVKYAGLHLWVRKNLQRPKLCSRCNISQSREVANLDGKYSRNLISWAWLCRSCHLRMDNVAEKAWTTKKGRIAS